MASEPKRATICVGITLSMHRLDIVQLLLADLDHQTERAAEVAIIAQTPDPDEFRRCADVLARAFPQLPLRIEANAVPGPSAARELLLHGEADVTLFMDDDARMPPEALERVADAFGRWPDAAVITFSARWTGEGSEHRRYPDEPQQRRTRRSVSSVAAIEIAASRRRTRELGVGWDTRFGPASTFPTGEEFVFVADVLRAGGVVRFEPAEISEHPALTGGYRLDRSAMYGKGAVFRRTYGRFGLAAVAYLTLRKTLARQFACSPFEAFTSALRGWHDLGSVTRGGQPPSGARATSARSRRR